VSADEQVYVQALALGLDPAWRRLSDAERHEDGCRFVETHMAGERDGLRTVSYSSIGLEPGVDLLFWRMASSVDVLEGSAAGLFRARASAAGSPFGTRNSRCSQASARATSSSTHSPRAPIGTSFRRRRARA